LWKSVQIGGLQPVAEELCKFRGDGAVRSRVVRQVGSVRACSACSGDYEDPEESVWDDPNEEDAGEPDVENAEQPEGRE
jgi:hypothetical protein